MRLLIFFLISLISHANENYSYNFQDTSACGQSGTIKDRIKDCNKHLGNFSLVTRNEKQIEVYQQNNNGLLWSHLRDLSLTSVSLEKNLKNVCNGEIPEVAGLSFIPWNLPSQEQFLNAASHGITEIGILKDSYLWTTKTKRTLFSGKIRWIFYGDGKGARLDHNGELTKENGFYDDLGIGTNSIICVGRYEL